nr:unnamed protein product [Callosobruchus analis]
MHFSVSQKCTASKKVSRN